MRHACLTWCGDLPWDRFRGRLTCAVSPLAEAPQAGGTGENARTHAPDHRHKEKARRMMMEVEHGRPRPETTATAILPEHRHS